MAFDVCGVDGHGPFVSLDPSTDRVSDPSVLHRKSFGAVVLLQTATDPCRVVNFLGFAGLAVYCRNAAIHSDGSNSGRGRRALETALLTRSGADCDASRFEDDILATWYRYQPAKQPFLPELPGQKRSPPEVRNSLWTRG
jgi:hypothetical protein